MLDDPAGTGTGAGAEAQLGRAMQGAAIPIIGDAARADLDLVRPALG